MDQLLLQQADPLAGRVVLVHAAPPVVPQGALHVTAHVRGVLALEVEVGEALVGTAMEVELGHEGRDPLARDLRSLTKRLIGVHRREQLREPRDLTDLPPDHVEGRRDLLGGGPRELEQRVQPRWAASS